jgi:hypothetical protein
VSTKAGQVHHLAIAQIDGCRARTISMVVLVVLVVLVVADVAQLISRSLPWPRDGGRGLVSNRAMA